MFYLLPPAGTPTSLRDILAAIRLRLGGQGEQRFVDKLASRFGAKHAFLVNSGRTAQWLLLRGLAAQAGSVRSEVVVPAYTCFSVASSVVCTGLKIRLVDIDPMTMDYRYDKLAALDYSRVLAVIAANLFGIVSDWERLDSLKRSQNVFLIDDSAQAMGSVAHGKSCGTCGDGGFFSLDRGKSLSTYAGGVLMTDNDQLRKAIHKMVEELPRPGIGTELAVLAKVILYGLLLRPRCYWFPDMLPFLGLGETEYDASFSASRLSKVQSSLGAVILKRLDDLNCIRQENAVRLAEAILPVGRFEIPGYAGGNHPVYLRLPLLAPDHATRDRSVAALRKVGVVASTMYPSTIRDIPAVAPHLASGETDFPGARRVVECLLTLPVHPYVKSGDIKRMADTLASV